MRFASPDIHSSSVRFENLVPYFTNEPQTRSSAAVGLIKSAVVPEVFDYIEKSIFWSRYDGIGDGIEKDNHPDFWWSTVNGTFC